MAPSFWKMKPFCALLSAFRKYSTKTKVYNGNARKPRISRAERENIEWTEQQTSVLEAVGRRESVFITGSAGTGKTRLVMEVIKMLRKIYGANGVYVTASTGVAACALKGQTLHSFAGVGLGLGDASTLLSKVRSNKRALRIWRETKALVIDEISMVDGELFDKIEYIARNVRHGMPRAELPWGGIQLVVSGDFLQLPPVNVGRKSDAEEFAFEAKCWEGSFQFLVALNTTFRQSDPDHIRLLQGIRKGELDPEDLKLLEQRFCADENELDEMVVRLFPRFHDVDRVNQKRLRDLGEEIVPYEAFDTGKEPWLSQLNQGIAPARLELCVGARVMLTKNLNVRRKLVNGATGTVTGFVKVQKRNAKKICRHHEDVVLPMVRFDSGYELIINPEKWEVIEGDEVFARRFQLPLILAWAMSIHKSQGMTLEKLHTVLSKAFGCGLVYVVLSRVKSLSGLYLSGFHPSIVNAHPKVLSFYEKFSS